MLTSRPGNKGRRYPADPPRVEEVIAVMKQAGEGAFGSRLRGLIVVLWRAGLRISEALALTEGDLEIARGSVVVRCGKSGRRRALMLDRGMPRLDNRRFAWKGAPIRLTIHSARGGRPAGRVVAGRDASGN
jgi:site-specific recombinase XerC